MEILITLLIVVLACCILYWFAGRITAPLGQWVQIVIIAAGAIWLLTHVREIVHGIANL